MLVKFRLAHHAPTEQSVERRADAEGGVADGVRPVVRSEGREQSVALLLVDA